MLMKVLESRRGYLYNRLDNILSKRAPDEADVIRNQYQVMAEEAEADRLASKAEEAEAQQISFDKMLRFLENYSRVQESHNIKIQEQINQHNESQERIKL